MARIRGKAGGPKPQTSSNKTEAYQWLKSLPLAPEYHPTLDEFQDPIAYIYKIEKEASKYGICKIIPPVSLPSKKTTLFNLNQSLLACSQDKLKPTFTTRVQQVGFCPRKHRPVNKSVWESGETYTVSQFEDKAKLFDKAYFKKSLINKGDLSPLEIETLYWKANVDKPFDVEYANDMPGSAFVNLDAKKGREEGLTVGETEWNMRGAARAKGSLLRFIKDDIPGVTSPMVYMGMMFSWFAWHVEDHDLHSLNYMHMGAGKTWYGVPKDASIAFEDVIRNHGYGGEMNRISAYATLGKKTTVMSPEVILNAGIPCCRLVQNAGEFVVTFPRAYHSGFSHGFNCAEASNIATPEWLRFAREAAIRRASINCPPLVSHIQLLYNLALSFSSRVQLSIAPEPRSFRLKEKKRDEGESLVKELFVQDVMQNTDLLYSLGKGSQIILLPRDFVNISMWAKAHVRSRSKVNSRLSFGLRCPDDKAKVSSDFMVDEKQGINQLNYSMAGKFPKLRDGNSVPLFSKCSDFSCTATSQNQNIYTEEKGPAQCERLPNTGLFSCVTCGVLCFACAAIIQPSEVAAYNLMSADCSSIGGRDVASEVAANDRWTHSTGDANTVALDSGLGRMAERSPNYLFDVPVQCEDRIETNGIRQPSSGTETPIDKSSLDLLALMYADSSEPDEDQVDASANVYKTESSRLDIDGSDGSSSPGMVLAHVTTNRSSVANHTESAIGSAPVPIQNRAKLFASTSDEDSSRLHVFCLQHAVEVEQKLRALGGVHMLLLCHPDYPKLEAETKLMADELGSDHHWSNITFRTATEEVKERIKSALNSEGSIHGNADWAVKLGVNLFYSANLTRSPLYSKQMPYNSVIYSAFGHRSSADIPAKPKLKQKKIAVAGKWCGKVWMSNQVHPLLAERVHEEQEQVKVSQTLAKQQLPEPIVMPEKPSKSQTIDLSSESSKATWKRKSMADIEPTSRGKSLKVEEPVKAADHAPNNKCIITYKRTFRNKLKEKVIKEESPQPGKNRDQDAEQFDINVEDKLEGGGPSTRLRKRTAKQPTKSETKLVVDKGAAKTASKKHTCSKREKRAPGFQASATKRTKIEDEEAEYACKMEGCTMRFGSNYELMLHEKNLCAVKGCRKKFVSHKYLLQHRKVHLDDRPLKCPWKGCKMTFKWAWARTEHFRVHTGARPYTCGETGCGKTFRFVSDFSRHKRKTGHSGKIGQSTKKGNMKTK